MTPDQEARCAALAKRIAELDPNWAQAGMACRDLDGAQYRLAAHRFGRFPMWCRIDAGDGALAVVCDAPTANGPDWTDDATLGAILLSLGDVLVTGRSDGGTCVQVLNGAHVSAICATRTEAILAAKVAQLQQEASNG